MLHIRVVTAGALLLLMAGAAAAQSDGAASTAAPEKPVSLLQLLLKPAASSEPTQDETGRASPDPAGATGAYGAYASCAQAQVGKEIRPPESSRRRRYSGVSGIRFGGHNRSAGTRCCGECTSSARSIKYERGGR